MISFWDFVSMGRPQWRGQTSLLKAVFFLIFGTHDIHTRLRNSHVINRIERLELPSDSRVLEGGFGRAIVLLWLARRHPGWRLTGVELDPMMAGCARRVVDGGNYANVEIVEGTIENLDAEGTYDLAISIDTMEHIEDDEGFLQRHLRALKPGGYLVLHVPRRHQEMWHLIPAFRRFHVHGFVRDKHTDEGVRQVHLHGHVRDEYTIEELRQVAERTGFKVLDLRETVGRWGEVAFELNHLFWRYPPLRLFLALLTFPITLPTGYIDVLRDPSRGNSLLLTAVRE